MSAAIEKTAHGERVVGAYTTSSGGSERYVWVVYAIHCKDFFAVFYTLQRLFCSVECIVFNLYIAVCVVVSASLYYLAVPVGE